MRLWAIAFFFLTSKALSQDTIRLSLSDVMEQILDNHPVISQANLQTDLAEAELRAAKGAFDPKIVSSYNQKKLDDKTYYDKFSGSLKIPTWFPVDPKIAFYKNEGLQLNPEDYVSSKVDFMQMTAGLSLPLGKGLFIDERRTLVRQAQAFGDIAESEKIKLTNKLLFTVAKAYWEWYLTYEKLQLLKQSLSLSQNIYTRTLSDFDFGESSGMDTIQASITLQEQKIALEKARLEHFQKKQELSIHLWSEEGLPLEISAFTIPVFEQSTLWSIPSDSSVMRLIQWSQTNHPDIQKLTSKQLQYEYAEKWSKESLKPTVDLTYSLIDAPLRATGVAPPLWTDSYKLGIDMSFPIYLRKERGSLQKNRVYKETFALEIQQEQQSIAATIKNTHAAMLTTSTLTELYQNMSISYEKLLSAEILNLENGESDLFKLNIQQEKYINAKIKLLDATVKLEKLKAQLPFDSGLPGLSYLIISKN